MQLAQRLSQIFGAKHGKQQQCWMIFDLDWTLFDNRGRTHRILIEYASAHEEQEPHLLASVLAFPLTEMIYRVRDCLAKLGWTETDLIESVEQFWFTRFFDPAYLRFDLLVPGAVRFVQWVHAQGIGIIYLTGRSLTTGPQNTVAQLSVNGFPLGTSRTLLRMKPQDDLRDFTFKRQVVEELISMGPIVATFENEPRIANMMHAALPDALTVLIDTQFDPHSPALNPEIYRVSHFGEVLELLRDAQLYPGQSAGDDASG